MKKLLVVALAAILVVLVVAPVLHAQDNKFFCVPRSGYTGTVSAYTGFAPKNSMTFKSAKIPVGNIDSIQVGFLCGDTASYRWIAVKVYPTSTAAAGDSIGYFVGDTNATTNLYHTKTILGSQKLEGFVEFTIPFNNTGNAITPRVNSGLYLKTFRHNAAGAQNP